MLYLYYHPRWPGGDSDLQILSVATPTTPGAWHLVLQAGSDPANSLVHLKSSDNTIVAVWSAPIHFVATSSNSSNAAPQAKKKKFIDNSIKKLDETRRVFQFTSIQDFENGSSRDRRVVIVEKTSFELDKKIWDAGVGMSIWISQTLIGNDETSPAHSTTTSPSPEETTTEPNGGHPAPSESVRRPPEETTNQPSGSRPALQEIIRIFRRPNFNVVELGSGTGLVSIILGAILNEFQLMTASDPETSTSQLSKPPASPGICRIHATDLPSAEELIRRNIEGNRQLYSSLGTASEESPRVILTAGVLDWEDNELPEEITAFPPDLLIMSDVTYNNASFLPLLQTIKRLGNIAPNLKVILAYKERHSSEGQIWDMFETAADVSLWKVDQLPGVGGAPIEIWIGQHTQ